MKEERDWESENFERLLGWLDADHERAGARYEEIRRGLVKIFTSRGCSEPEVLADDTITRVCRKVHAVAPAYDGDPAVYFYGVAQNVHLEHLRRMRRRAKRLKLVENYLLSGAREHDVEPELRCLDLCLAELTEASRELVLEYYRDDGAAKIERRRRLAERLGLRPAALRLRAFRVRAALEDCVRARLEEDRGGRA